MFCSDITPPIFYLFSEEVPKLLYYSHIPTSVMAVILALFVYHTNRKSLTARLFLLSTVLFFLWAIFDIALWVNVDSRIITFVWSFINVLETGVSATMLYFAYVFLEKKDAPTGYKMFGFMLLLPLIILMSSDWNISQFDLGSCEALQGPLIYYFYVIEGLFSLWLIAYLAKKYIQAKKGDRSQILLFSTGVVFFLVAYSGTNILGSITQNWELLMYGFFGVPVFIGLLVWLMVYHQAFSVKLLSTQALVGVLVVLIGSQFFFAQDSLSRSLNLISFIVACFFGYILVNEVKKEVKRKEELQQISDKLAVANEELRRLDNAKSEFISIASHQLRTPLTAIKGFVSLLLEGAYGKIPGPVQDTLNKVYISNSRLMQLVENLLNISRIESGRIQYQFVPEHIENIITELTEMFALAVYQKGIKLTVHLPKEKLRAVTLDATKIREVISNLIDNALKYTRKGEIRVTLKSVSDGVEIAVKDTGMGIDPDDLPHLFNKFERGKLTATVNVSSTGLGLYVGKSFVEAHGGTISIASPGPGHGATFTIHLPWQAKVRKA